MWIVPAKSLSESELAMLGNNLRPAEVCVPRRRRPQADWVTAGVNRSLKVVCERVAVLHRRTALAS